MGPINCAPNPYTRSENFLILSESLSRNKGVLEADEKIMKSNLFFMTC